MLYEFTYEGKGVIDFCLRSTSKRFVLHEGESRVIDVKAVDKQVILALKSLKVMSKEVAIKPTVIDTVPVQKPEEVKIEEPKVEVPEVIEIDEPKELPEENAVETEASEDKEKLMQKTKAQLVKMAEELGIAIPDKASKRDIVGLICND